MESSTLHVHYSPPPQATTTHSVPSLGEEEEKTQMISVIRTLPALRLYTASTSHRFIRFSSAYQRPSTTVHLRPFSTRSCPSPSTMSSPITKIVRFITTDGSTQLGEPIPNTETATVLTGDPFQPSSLQRTSQTLPITSYLPPIQPISIQCIGLNYKDHAHEANMDLPKAPMLFMKNIASAPHPTSLPPHPLPPFH
jgi:hypothetical protein